MTASPKSTLLRLLESKSLGDYRGLRQRDLLLRSSGAVTRPEAERAAAQAELDMQTLVASADAQMAELVSRYKNGRLGAAELSRRLSEVLRRVYFEIFVLGARASRNPQAVRGFTGLLPQEQEWLSSALATEQRFLDRLIKGIVQNKERWSLGYMQRRLRNYAESAKAMYQAGRVAGLSPLNIIEWEARGDGRTCRECRLLRDFGPYLRHTLPTTPKAGDTRCLMNCRCTLRVHPASPEQVKVQQAMSYDKSYYLRLLRLSRSRPDNLPRVRGRAR